MKPAKLLPVHFQLGAPEPVDSNGRQYRFTATLTSDNPQIHSDFNEGGSYDLTDVAVGDYVSTSVAGRIMKIVTVSSQSLAAATIIVEDEFRLNQQQDSSQNSSAFIESGVGVVFEVREGKPILYPYGDKSTIVVGFIENYSAEIMARFDYQRSSTLYTITQSAPDLLSLQIGDLITYDSIAGKYKLFEATDEVLLGTVIEIENPTADTFRINPTGEVIDIALTGTGPYYYFDNNNPGKLTETLPILSERKIPVFFKLSSTQAIYFDGGAAGAGSSEDSVFSSGTLTVENGESTFASYKLYVLYNTTTDNTPTELFLDGTSTRITLTDDTTMMFEADIVGRESTGADHCAFRLQGVIDKTNATTVIINTVNETVVAQTDDVWEVSVTADDINDAIAVTVTGNNDTIRWTGFVKTVVITH